MHKVSRTLLLAGVLAFGGLTAACDSGTTTVVGNIGVQSITLTPPSATISAGSTIQLAVSVVADASTAKTVTYTTSSAAVATVDATGKVTGVGAGTATIIATSTADATKAAASVITVTAVIINLPNPSIAINSVTDVNGNPVTLNNVNGQINVTVNTSGGGLIEVFLSSSCASNTIAASDVAVASQQATSAQPGTVTLSFNTAQLTAANQARFANGNYCIKTRLTNGASVVVATNTVPLTLNNANVFTATLAFASQTGGPTTAVSSLNGLNYNQGTLTITLNPVIFTGSSPAVFISGTFTRKGEVGGVAQTPISFTNATVASGVATIVLTDTSATGVNSIFGYTSLPAGDTLYVTSATDASGNPIPVGVAGLPVSVQNARGIRIDNQTPSIAGAAFAVTAPNGYIPASYVFSTGTSGTTPSDTHPPVVGGNPGVGGVTITYYVGASSAAAFTPANSCNITGLTATTNTSNLANTTSTSADRAKVVVKDALGNQSCADAPSTLVGGGGNFGVDKITPEASFVTTTVNALAGVADLTGYNASRGFNLSFRDSISGFPQTAGSSPFTGTVKRVTAAAATAADCVVGTYNATTGACADVAISTANVPSFFETTQPGSSFLLGGFQFTNGTNVAGYYTANLTTTDVAGNVLPAIARTAAYDATAPGVAAPTQAAAAVPLGTATITAAATDNLDLISSRGNLIYTGLVTFARVTGNALGTFGQTITSANATVTLSNVYRGMQDGSTGTIGAAAVLPSASVTVTDVGTNTATSATTTITTTTASAPIFVGQTVSLTSSAAAGTAGASVATTNLTFQINGLSNDPAFQSQPFNGVDIYKLNSNGEYAFVTSVTAATVVDNTTTGVRTYSYVANGVALTAGPAATNTFIAVAHNAAGDAVRSPSATQLNP